MINHEVSAARQRWELYHPESREDKCLVLMDRETGKVKSIIVIYITQKRAEEWQASFHPEAQIMTMDKLRETFPNL